jgi:hypothetical protein
MVAKILQEGTAAKESKPIKTGRHLAGVQISLSLSVLLMIIGYPDGFINLQIQVSISTEVTAVDFSGSRFLVGATVQDDIWKSSSDRLS